MLSVFNIIVIHSCRVLTIKAYWAGNTLWYDMLNFMHDLVGLSYACICLTTLSLRHSKLASY